MNDIHTDMMQLLDRTKQWAERYLASLEDGGVAPRATLEELRGRFVKPLEEVGIAPLEVIDDLVRDVAEGVVRSAGGRFFGWVIGGALPAALAADWLTTVWDQNAVLVSTSPAAAVVEEVVGGWIKELLGLPAQSSFALVSGCQMAHTTCLAAARGAILRPTGWDVAEQGLVGAPRLRILANERRHASIERAAILLGMGRSSVAPVETDRWGRIEPSALREALLTDAGTPTIVVLQAGDIETGAFDDFETLIPLAKGEGAWVHIDGAFGLWARASARYRGLAKGCELADSWATDGHKMLNTPFDCGYAVVAHPADHKAVFSLRASYLTHATEARDPIDWTPEWSRRARGFTTYAALRSLGRRGVAQLFENCCRQTRALAAEISALPGAELLSEPIINQALIRFRDSRDDAHQADHDRQTDAVIGAVNASGEAFFSGSNWGGCRVMRVSVCNWRTTDRDVTRTVEAFRRVLRAGC